MAFQQDAALLLREAPAVIKAVACRAPLGSKRSTFYEALARAGEDPAALEIPK